MAKMAVYVQRGEALDYKNGTNKIISAGTVILLGNRIGVVAGEIAPGETGAIHVVGVFEMAKKAETALAAGDNVVFTDADGIDKATDIVMGYAAADAAAGATTVLVKLLG